MTTAVIRQKLYEYIRFADDQKIKAFYTIISPETKENSDWWKDKELIADLDRMDKAMDDGDDKGITWPEAKKKLLERSKRKRNAF